MKNIYIIPTDKPSRLMIDTIENKLYLQPILHEKTINVLPQHIYITNSEEIKEGDYFIENGMYVSNGSVGPISDTFIPRRNQKIILTTDQDLIKYGIQVIDDEFLEWFVKNPTCEFVEIFHQDVYSMGKWDRRYKIIIPKEEPKKELEMLEVPMPIYKQETLEEAASRLLYSKYPYHPPRDSGYWKDMFIEGAKWKQERSYSEEEVKLLLLKNLKDRFLIDDIGIPEWFEQFKKK